MTARKFDEWWFAHGDSIRLAVSKGATGSIPVEQWLREAWLAGAAAEGAEHAAVASDAVHAVSRSSASVALALTEVYTAEGCLIWLTNVNPAAWWPRSTEGEGSQVAALIEQLASGAFA